MIVRLSRRSDGRGRPRRQSQAILPPEKDAQVSEMIEGMKTEKERNLKTMISVGGWTYRHVS